MSSDAVTDARTHAHAHTQTHARAHTHTHTHEHVVTKVGTTNLAQEGMANLNPKP